MAGSKKHIISAVIILSMSVPLLAVAADQKFGGIVAPASAIALPPDRASVPALIVVVPV